MAVAAFLGNGQSLLESGGRLSEVPLTARDGAKRGEDDPFRVAITKRAKLEQHVLGRLTGALHIATLQELDDGEVPLCCCHSPRVVNFSRQCQAGILQL